MSNLAITALKTASYLPKPTSVGATEGLLAALVRMFVAARGSCDGSIIDQLSQSQLADAGIDRFASRPHKPSIAIEAGLMARLMLMR